jgi:hypothetical protein
MAAIALDIVVHFGFGIAPRAIRTDALDQFIARRHRDGR